ncbi:hypothetical protein ACFL0C_00470 [Patescibacteria group bacterium]
MLMITFIQPTKIKALHKGDARSMRKTLITHHEGDNYFLVGGSQENCGLISSITIRIKNNGSGKKVQEGLNANRDNPKDWRLINPSTELPEKVANALVKLLNVNDGLPH